MDVEKYSKQRFQSCDAPGARVLADRLEDEVVKEIHGAVYEAFLKVIEALNDRGHKLSPYEEIRPGVLSFRDEPGEGQWYLRLACDVVISAGYSDMRAADELEAEIMKGSN